MRYSQYRDGRFSIPREPVVLNPYVLLAYIAQYIREHEGVAPAYPEMMKAMGVTSKNSIARAMHRLIDERRIRVLPHRARAIEVVSQVVPDTSAPRPQFIDTRGWKAFRWDDTAKALVPMEGQE